MKFKTILFLLTIFFALNFIEAQELQPITSYSPKEYNAWNQNWDISQASDKYIYIANNKGLLEFNGTNWATYPLPNKSVVRCVKVVSNKIFTGGYMDFGYWIKNKYGILNYYTLKTKVNQPLLEDETFWNIISYENFVLFQSLNRIYIYDLENKTFKIINSKSKRAEIFKVDDVIYFQKTGGGIYKIENGKAKLITDSKLIKNTEVVGIFSKSDKILFLTEKGVFYSLDKNKLVKWHIPADKIISKKKIYSSLQLKDKSFVLGTISDGMYHLNSKGEILERINKEQGLLNNTVLSIFEDYDNNLWLGLDNGINVLNLNSPYSIYNDLKGDVGAVYTSIVFYNKLYLGTNQGLFFRDLGSNKPFTLVKNTKGQVWCLENLDNKLFCGHNKGTFLIKNDFAEKISDFPGTWRIKKVPNNSNILLQGNYEGLSILKKKGNAWRFNNQIKNFDISSRFFEFINDSTILVNHEYSGLFKLEIDKDFTEVKQKQTHKPFGIKSSIFKYHNKIKYVSEKGVLSLVSTKNIQFKKDSVLSALTHNGADPIIGNFIVDNNNNKIWGITKNNIAYVKYGNLTNKPKIVKIPLQYSNKSSMSISGFENISPIKGQKYLIGNTEGYTILDLEKYKPTPFNITVNKVFKQKLDHKKEPLAISEFYNLNSNENTLHFTYSVLNFNKNIEINYQYLLEGYNSGWSNWTQKTSTTFENLPFGEYSFKVRARIGNQLSQNEASYIFEIDRPWYLSNLMIVFYILMVILSTFIIHLLYKRHYTKQKQKVLQQQQNNFNLSQLESEKLIMRLKNEKLQNEIENKTKELSMSTINIVKKNELLSEIKSELLAAKDSSDINSVIKTINKNLNKSSDWQIFVKAFNNADRDFLKKIKSLHPKLTPNDLRLCAYLRLNLSTKEIAPLLNISIRSVEIKRYRLRKKMDLAHDSRLVEYILNI